MAWVATRDKVPCTMMGSDCKTIDFYKKNKNSECYYSKNKCNHPYGNYLLGFQHKTKLKLPNGTIME